MVSGDPAPEGRGRSHPRYRGVSDKETESARKLRLLFAVLIFAKTLEFAALVLSLESLPV